MNTKNRTNLDIVRLIKKTTKIESMLESLGATGGGIWDKADSISKMLPNNFIQKIIKIATVRNNAIHGDLHVENMTNVVLECEYILNILEKKKKIARLKEEIDLKLNEFHYFDENNTIELSSHHIAWIEKLNASAKTIYDNEVIDLLLKEGDSKIIELSSYAKKYVLKKRLKQLPIFLLGSIALFYLYFWIGTLYDR